MNAYKQAKCVIRVSSIHGNLKLGSYETILLETEFLKNAFLWIFHFML